MDKVCLFLVAVQGWRWLVVVVVVVVVCRCLFVVISYLLSTLLFFFFPQCLFILFFYFFILFFFLSSPQVSLLAEDGVRSLAVAKTDANGQWRFQGMLTFLDPPREDTKDTILRANNYGM